MNTLKRVTEYVGAKYKHGGDIRSSIINGKKMTIPVPTAPTIADPANPTATERVQELIFKGKIDAYIKRESILDDNVQKAFSLVLGQCTDLLQSKLKQQANWATVSREQDVIALLEMIKNITFKFDDQKFLPLALYNAKAALYSLRQNNMSNHDYLQKFNNLVDVSTTYNGQLYDQAIVDIACERLHPGTDFETLGKNEKAAVHDAANELYKATMFVHQSDKRRYGKLMEDLENSYTKGNDDYPQDLVSTYHLINE